MFQQTGLVRVLTNSLLECNKMPKLSEAVTACLMRLYCHPGLRSRSGLDMSIILSPFTSLPHADTQDQVIMSRLECTTTCLLSLIRSWPGLLHITSDHLRSKPLQSLIDSLYLPSYQARRSIL